MTENRVIKSNIIYLERFDDWNELNIFPNPVTDILTVKSAEPQRIRKLQIYNTLGMLIKNDNLNETYHRIDVSELEPACYVLLILDSNGNQVHGGNL